MRSKTNLVHVILCIQVGLTSMNQSRCYMFPELAELVTVAATAELSFKQWSHWQYTSLFRDLYTGYLTFSTAYCVVIIAALQARNWRAWNNFGFDISALDIAAARLRVSFMQYLQKVKVGDCANIWLVYDDALRQQLQYHVQINCPNSGIRSIKGK